MDPLLIKDIIDDTGDPDIHFYSFIDLNGPEEIQYPISMFIDIYEYNHKIEPINFKTTLQYYKQLHTLKPIAKAEVRVHNELLEIKSINLLTKNKCYVTTGNLTILILPNV